MDWEKLFSSEGFGLGVQGVSGLAGSYLQSEALKEQAAQQAKLGREQLAYQQSRDAVEDARYDAGTETAAAQSANMSEGFNSAFLMPSKKKVNPITGLVEGEAVPGTTQVASTPGLAGTQGLVPQTTIV